MTDRLEPCYPPAVPVRRKSAKQLTGRDLPVWILVAVAIASLSVQTKETSDHRFSAQYKNMFFLACVYYVVQYFDLLYNVGSKFILAKRMLSPPFIINGIANVPPPEVVAEVIGVDAIDGE